MKARLFPKLERKHWIYRLLTVIFVLAFLGTISIGGYIIYDDWSPYSYQEPVFEFQPEFSDARGGVVSCHFIDTAWTYGTRCDGARVQVDRRQVVEDFFIKYGTTAPDGEFREYENMADTYIRMVLNSSEADLDHNGVIDGEDVFIAHQQVDQNGGLLYGTVSDVYKSVMGNPRDAILIRVWNWSDLGVATLWMLVLLLASLVGYWVVYRVFVYVVAGK